MSPLQRTLRERLLPAVTAFGDNPTLSAIRAGMVAVVPLTIIGGLFMIAAHLPITGWEERIAAWRPMQIGRAHV